VIDGIELEGLEFLDHNVSRIKMTHGAAKQKNGKVYDPNTGEELVWSKEGKRNWDMGHKPGKEYKKLHKDYMDGKITKDEFLKEYRNPQNYQPESQAANRSRKYEKKS
jgi:hypothetical protein